MNREATDWEKIFACLISDKGVSRIHKKLLKLNEETTHFLKMDKKYCMIPLMWDT